MEVKEKKSTNISLRLLLITATVGIWILVLQNFGIIPTSQNVRVTNKVGVTGSVDASVSGSVNIDNTVDVNLQEINGHRNCFYDNASHRKQYYSIPVAEI
jgi:hypothetical protein